MAASIDDSILDVTRPFTYAAGRKAGLTPGRLRGSGFRRIFYGVYIATEARRPFERIEAAMLVHDCDAFASHSSAARIYDLPIPERLTDEHVTVFRRKDRHGLRGLQSHLALHIGATREMHGIRVSAPWLLFLELASILDLVELVVVGDAMVRARLTTTKELVAAAAQFEGRHAVLVRRAASLVRAEVDSPMETRLRLLLVLAGLPEPVVNFKVYYEDGRLRYRFDLSYPDLKLIVEYDGRQHRDDLDQWDRDNDRDDWFDDNDWRIVKVFSRGIYKEPEKTLDRVRNALASRGCRTLPRRYDQEWRRYFPGRPS